MPSKSPPFPCSFLCSDMCRSKRGSAAFWGEELGGRHTLLCGCCVLAVGSGMMFVACMCKPCPDVFKGCVLWLVWLRIHSFDSRDAPVISCAPSPPHSLPTEPLAVSSVSSFHSAAHPARADLTGCPLASTHYLYRVLGKLTTGTLL